MTWFQKKLNEKKLSQRQVAERMGIHPSTLSRLVNGKRGAMAEEIRLLSRIIGVPMEKTLKRLTLRKNP